MRFLPAFIMKGRMQAMMVASILALLSLPFFPVSIVSSATVALVTLRRGALEGLYVLIGAGAAASLLSLFLGSYQFALLYGFLLLLLWIPVWLVAIVLRESRRLTLALEISALFGVVAVTAVYLFHPEPAQIWREVLPVMAQLMHQAQPDLSVVLDKDATEILARLMTGNMAAGAVIALFFELFIARWWQALLYNPGGFRAEYLALKGHVQPAIATMAIAVLYWLASGVMAEACRNILTVLVVLYIFIGIAILHSVLAAMKGRDYLVPLFYVTLLIIQPIMGLVGLFGLIDTWLDLRNKLKPNGA